MAGDRDQLRAHLEDLADRYLLDVLIERLEGYKETLPVEKAVPFLTALFDVGERLSPESKGFFGLDTQMHAIRVAYWFLKQEPAKSKRAEILQEVVAQTTGLALPIRFISIEDPREDETTQSGGDQLLEEDALPALRSLSTDKIRSAAVDGRLLAHDELPMLLYRWVRWTDEAEPKKWAAQVTATPDGASRFVGAFARKSRSLSMGEYVYRENWELKTSELEDFVDMGKLVETLRGADLSGKPEPEQQGVAILLKEIATT